MAQCFPTIHQPRNKESEIQKDSGQPLVPAERPPSTRQAGDWRGKGTAEAENQADLSSSLPFHWEWPKVNRWDTWPS